MRKTAVERLVEAQLNLAGILDPEVINQLMEAHFNECLARQARNGSPHRVFVPIDGGRNRAALRLMGFTLTAQEAAAHMNLLETARQPESLSNLSR